MAWRGWVIIWLALSFSLVLLSQPFGPVPLSLRVRSPHLTRMLRGSEGDQQQQQAEGVRTWLGLRCSTGSCR